MKNIYLIPTDKPEGSELYQPQNMYITSDEDIKRKDYVYNTVLSIVLEAKREGTSGENGWKKVILTTDEDLIKNGVQKIDNEFLEWFVKNSDCEFVEVVNVRDKGVYGSLNPYKIIIPKEEQKQHIIKMMQNDEELGLYGANIIDTWLEKNGDPEISKQVKREAEELMLENAAEKLYPKRESFLSKFQDIEQKAFIDGANWMAERMYSEDEVRTIINDIVEKHCSYFQQELKNTVKSEWFEQFKK